MTGHAHILFAPLLPVWSLVALAVVAVFLSIVALVRRARGMWLRTTLFALLLTVLANPALIREVREPLKDTALLVIDESASMKLGHRAEEARRTGEAVAQKLASFPDLDVETVHVAGENETDLFQAIEQKQAALPADRLAGVIAITDGQIHDAPQMAVAGPFHALIAGRKDEIDRRIIVRSAPSYGLIGKTLTLTLRVEDEPKPQSETASVVFTDDDGKAQTLTVPVGKDVPVETVLHHTGANQLVFEAEPLPQELTTINNVATVNVNGVREKLRVLLVSGEPNAAGRNWRNLLKSDPIVDLVHFTILRSPFKDNSVPNAQLALIAFPTREIFETRLKDFDLIVFDGVPQKTIISGRYFANIADYVQNGGALLVACADGQQALELSQTPLGKILPLQAKGETLTGAFVPALLEAGRRHPITATLEQIMPRRLWSPWYRQGAVQTGGHDDQVLLAGLNQNPLLVVARAGKGRVAEFSSNQFWLWSKEYPQGGPEGELLRRTFYWLIGEPALDETALRASAKLGENGWAIEISKRSLNDDPGHVVVTGPDQQPVNVALASGDTPGLMEATVPVRQSGLYRVKDETHDVMAIAAAPQAPEYEDMVATAQKLNPVVSASGGGTFWLSEHPEGPNIRRTDKGDRASGWGWIGLRKNGQYHVTGSTSLPLWPAWAALLVVLAVAMAMWKREGKT